MARGGRRSGTPGKAYGNRSDLNGGPLPVTTVPGGVYGSQAAQARAQQAVPMAPAPLNAAPPAVAPPAAGGAPSVQPGQMGAFDRPTERPGEPVTSGMPIGPGAGIEALGLPQTQAQNLGQFINQLAGTSGSSSIQYLAQYINGGRQ